MFEYRPKVVGFFDDPTFSVQHVVIDPASAHCAMIDPVCDFEPRAGSTATTSADRIRAYVRARGAARHRCASGGSPKALERHIQPRRRIRCRRSPVGPAVRRRRALSNR